jgi:hypothetical protein
VIASSGDGGGVPDVGVGEVDDDLTEILGVVEGVDEMTVGGEIA